MAQYRAVLPIFFERRRVRGEALQMNRADDLWPVLWPTVPERPVDALATCSRHFSAWPWNIINPLTIVMLSAAKIVGWGPMQTWPSLLAESGPFSSPARPVWPASVGFSISLSLQFLFLWRKKKKKKEELHWFVCLCHSQIHPLPNGRHFSSFNFLGPI